MQNKDIIFFTHIVPLPPNGGGTRSFHILKSLSATGNVDLVVFNPLNTKEKQSLEKICSQIFCVAEDITEHRKNRLIKLLSAIKWLLPFFMSNYELNGTLLSVQLKKTPRIFFFRLLIFKWFLYWFQFRDTYPSEVYRVEKNIHRLQKDIRQLLNEPGKILVFDFNYFLPAFAKKFDLKGHIIIGNSHNVEFDLLQQAFRFETDFFSKAWYKLQYQVMKKAEKTSLTISDKIFCCSVIDKNKYQQLYESVSVVIVPNGVDTKYFYPSSQQGNNTFLLFTGTMNYGPNMEGVNWFVKKVFPSLLKKHPGLIFVIAGKDADKLSMIAHKNIRIVSSPEDIRPCFHEACIYVVPLRQGGGTRLKILEAAAMQKPVVSTRLGAEGLEGLDASNIFLADSESEFSRAVSLLLGDEGLRYNISSNLYNWVKTYYSWEKTSEKMRKIIMDFNN